MNFGFLMQVIGSGTEIDRVVGKMVGKERNTEDDFFLLWRWGK